MRSFFRKIRKRFFYGGTTSKYLIYAIGEIALVVIGIIIALQVNNWNENRKQRTTEKDSIIRLHMESELIVEYFQEQIRGIDKRINESDAAGKALHIGTLSDIDSLTFIYGIGNIGLYPSVSPPKSVYQELSSTGKLMQIQSDSVRMKIVEYYTYLDHIDSQLEYFRQDVNVPKNFAPNDFYAVYDSTSSRRRGFRFNFDNLINNKSFIDAHASGLRDLIQFQSFRIEGRNLAVEMCKTVGHASGQNCTYRD